MFQNKIPPTPHVRLVSIVAGILCGIAIAVAIATTIFPVQITLNQSKTQAQDNIPSVEGALIEKIGEMGKFVAYRTKTASSQGVQYCYVVVSVDRGDIPPVISCP